MSNYFFIKQCRIITLITIIATSIIISGCSGASNYKNNTATNKNESIMAVILPMQDPSSAKILEAIKKGAGSVNKNLQIVAYDSSDDRSIKEAVSNIAQNNIKVILGPIYSSAVSTITPLIKNKDIKLFTLSNNSSLVRKNIFVMGHSPLEQAKYITKRYLRRGFRDFIILLPAGSYSYQISEEVQDLLKKKGAVLSKAEFYAQYDEAIQRSAKDVIDAVGLISEDAYHTKKPVVIIGDEPQYLDLILQEFAKKDLDEIAEITGDNRLCSIANLDMKLYHSFGYVKTAEVYSSLESTAYDVAKFLSQAMGVKYNEKRFNKYISHKEVFAGISGNFTIKNNRAHYSYGLRKKD